MVLISRAPALPRRSGVGWGTLRGQALSAGGACSLRLRRRVPRPRHRCAAGAVRR